MREVLGFPAFLGNTVTLKALGIKCPVDTYVSFPPAFSLEWQIF